MRRLLAPLVVLTMLLAGSAAWVSPAAAAPHSPARSPRAAGQEVGDTVTLFSTGGDEEGAFTITDLTDDFEDTEENPPSGERMVSLDVEIEADGGEFAVDPASFNLVDGNGVLWIDIPVTRTDDKESLEATDLADGDTVAGSLEIVIPEDVDILKLVYIVDAERVLTLLDNTSGVEAGDTVDLFTTDGEETGTIVADELIDDEDGVLGLVVTVENTGDEPLTVGPETFLAGDVNGTVWAADPSVEPEDSGTDLLESGEVAGGDSVTGFVGFSFDEDIPLDYVIYIPEARLYPVFDLDGPATGGDDASPVADDDDDLGPTDDDETPTTDDDETPVATDGDCAGVAEWEDASVALVQDWGAIVGAIDFTSADPDDFTDAAAEVTDIAEAQADLDAPAVTEELHDLLVTSYEDTAEALTDIADALDTGDDAAIGEAAETLQAIGESFQSGGEVDGALQDLRDACPDDVDEL